MASIPSSSSLHILAHPSLKTRSLWLCGVRRDLIFVACLSLGGFGGGVAWFVEWRSVVCGVV